MSAHIIKDTPKDQEITPKQIEAWFGGAISKLEADSFMMKQGIANPETADMYNSLITNDLEKIMLNVRKETTTFYVRSIITDFINILNSKKHLPDQLAFMFTNDKVRVWAEIEDEDEKAEDAILLSEAAINAKYHDLGFELTSIILEKADNVVLPKQYFPFPLHDFNLPQS